MPLFIPTLLKVKFSQIPRLSHRVTVKFPLKYCRFVRFTPPYGLPNWPEPLFTVIVWPVFIELQANEPLLQVLSVAYTGGGGTAAVVKVISPPQVVP
jgi:hypothetical protein